MIYGIIQLEMLEREILSNLLLVWLYRLNSLKENIFGCTGFVAARAFSGCGEQRLFFVASLWCSEILIALPSLVVETGSGPMTFSSCGM